MSSPSLPPTKDDYVFTRDFQDNNRLNLMHTLTTKVFGYLIHPKILQSIITPNRDGNCPTSAEQPTLHIADVGTGTAIWLCDVLHELGKGTNIEAYGFDISFDAAPPPSTLPKNLTLRKWDVREDLPEDMAGVFDIVHVRFFAFVLFGDEIPGVMGRLFKMLKPGGHLQWCDPDFDTIRIEKPGHLAINGLKSMHKLLSVQDPRLNPTWVSRLPDIFVQVGFENDQVDKNNCPSHWGFVLHECGLMVYELIYRKTKNEAMQKELRRLLPMAVEESRRGAWMTDTRWVVIGRKPGGSNKNIFRDE